MMALEGREARAARIRASYEGGRTLLASAHARRQTMRSRGFRRLLSVSVCNPP